MLDWIRPFAEEHDILTKTVATTLVVIAIVRIVFSWPSPDLQSSDEKPSEESPLTNPSRKTTPKKANNSKATPRMNSSRRSSRSASSQRSANSRRSAQAAVDIAQAARYSALNSESEQFSELSESEDEPEPQSTKSIRTPRRRSSSGTPKKSPVDRKATSKRKGSTKKSTPKAKRTKKPTVEEDLDMDFEEMKAWLILNGGIPSGPQAKHIFAQVILERMASKQSPKTPSATTRKSQSQKRKSRPSSSPKATPEAKKTKFSPRRLRSTRKK